MTKFSTQLIYKSYGSFLNGLFFSYENSSKVAELRALSSCHCLQSPRLEVPNTRSDVIWHDLTIFSPTKMGLNPIVMCFLWCLILICWLNPQFWRWNNMHWICPNMEGTQFQKLLFQYWEKPKFGVTLFQKTAIWILYNIDIKIRWDSKMHLSFKPTKASFKKHQVYSGCN